jgi:hypothetical protein
MFLLKAIYGRCKVDVKNFVFIFCVGKSRIIKPQGLQDHDPVPGTDPQVPNQSKHHFMPLSLQNSRDSDLPYFANALFLQKKIIYYH